MVRTKRSFYGARSSPYDKATSRPATPPVSEEEHKNGLFSRVVGFFRPQKQEDTQTDSGIPSAHSSPQNQQQNRPQKALYPVITKSHLSVSEPEVEEVVETSETVYTPSYTPPRHKRISLGVVKSPNQRLAEFFQKKGDTPLTDMETAGVISLISQVSEENPDLATKLSPTLDRSVRHSMSLASLAGRTETYESPSKIPRRVEPGSGLKKSRSMASIGQRNARVSRSSLGGARGVRGIPSPIMSSPKRQKQATSPVKPLEKAAGSSPVVSPSRPLSGVATSLLSLIDDDEEEPEVAKSPTKEFVNPYASSPRRPERQVTQFRPEAREKLMTPSPEKEKEKSSPQKTPSQIISLSMPLEQQRERDSVKAQPQMKKFDKYKPVRSSNLRDSFVADPKSPETKAKAKSSVSLSGSPESVPPSFTFGSKNGGFGAKLKSSSPSGDEDTDVKIGKDLASSAAIRSPSKPLYPEITKEKELKTPVPSTPKLAKAGIPSTPLSEASKKFGRDFDFSTPIKGTVPKPLTPAEKSKVDGYKKEYVF